MHPAKSTRSACPRLSYARRIDDKLYTAIILLGLGEIARLEGQYDQAASIFEEALQISHEFASHEFNLGPRLVLGFIYSRLGHVQQSKQIFRENLSVALKEEYRIHELALALLGLADLAASDGNAHLAANILGSIEPYKDRLTHWPTDRVEYERIMTKVKVQLGDNRFKQLFDDSRSLSLAEAAQLIQNPAGKEKEGEASRQNDLTPREIEILRLVAIGLSDAQVVERLVISPRTVNALLTSIYNKIGVSSRAAATRYAVDKGLV